MKYEGCTEHYFADEAEMAAFYENIKENSLNLLTNEYCLLYSPEGVLVDKIKWNDSENVAVSFKTVNNDWFSKIKPRNIEQELAFDMLQDKNTTVKLLTGRFGSGKTFLTICHAIQALRQNKFEKIVYIRNNIEVRNTQSIGYLPGNEIDKLLCYAMPLADALGGKQGLEMMIAQNKIEIQPLGFVRGRDFRSCFVMVSEAENLTADHVQLLIGRVGEGSIICFEGDNAQRDKDVFEKNNGIDKLINVLKGNPLFGYVNLQETERSATAALAELF